MISSKFTQVFASLPPEAQQNFVEKHLPTLLDHIPKEKAKKVLAAATRVQAKYKQVPKLDLRAKQKEVTWLLEELAKDAKISFIKERASTRSEILEEIIDSLLDWLNDIWSVVYEHNVNFSLAHSCLLFVTETLGQLSGSLALGGCKCLAMNLPVRVTIKDKTDKIVKHMSVLGPQNIDRMLLWIWRDLFVSLFSKGSKRERDKIPEMLEDIEDLLGVDGLEKLLYGGDADDQDGEDDEDLSEDLDAYYDDQSCVDDSDYDGDEYDRCRCHFHAKHWPEYINRARIPLRECIEQRLTRMFETAPSLRLYNTLLSISHNVFQTELYLSKKLSEIAGNTPDNLVAALDINIFLDDEDLVASLLKLHAHLLRPRDATTLQSAVCALEDSEYQSKASAILEQELEDSMRAIHATIRSCFSHIEDESNKKELLEILQLPAKSLPRKERLEQWSEHITSTTLNPMAVAAIMMGLPMFPGMNEGEDNDYLNYVDWDQNDPDLDDLREEYQPNLKQRFDGWVQLAQSMTGGPALLAKLYLKAVDLMPWLRGFDAATEMISRLGERPNKAHVADGLTILNSFAKMQRKKLNLARSEQTKNGANKVSATSSSARTAIPNVSSSSSSPAPASTFFSFGPSFNVHGPPPHLPFPFSTPGGMEDVD